MRLAIIMLLVVTKVAAAAERTENAALLYWRAFDLMPASDDFGPDPIVDAAGAATFMLDEAASMSLSDAEPALDLLVRATALRECVWGFDFEGEDFMSPITHPFSAQRLAAFAIVQARLLAAQGEHEQAIALLRGAVALARRAAVDAGMTGAPMQLEVERLATNAAIEMAPKTPASLRPRLDLLADDLPPRVTPPQWWDDERRLVTWARKAVARGTAEPLEDFMQMIRLVPDGDQALPAGQKLDAAKLNAMLDDLDTEYLAVGKLLALPAVQFAAEYHTWREQLKQRVKNNCCLVLLPGSADRLWTSDREVVAKLEKLKVLARQ